MGELLGTALLLAAVVGSGIMGDRLSGGKAAIALLAFLFRWLVPSLPKQARDIVMPRAEKELSHAR